MIPIPLRSALPVLLLAVAEPRAELAFRPAESTELAKTFETSLSLALDDLSIQVNGAEIDPAMIAPNGELDDANLSAALKFTVRDTYVSLGEGRPLELLRDYTGLSFTYEDGFGNTETNDDDEEIVGRTVRFRWNEGAAGYDRAFEGDAGSEDDLEMLAEDLDLRDLLPPDGTEEGGSWELRWSEHLALVLPGFDLGRLDRSRLDLDASDVPAEVVDTVLGELRSIFAEASATCTFQGIRELDGKRVGVVAIESRIDGTIDLRSVMEAAAAGNMPEGVSLDRCEIDLSLEIAGELVWDVAAGHFRSLDLGGELTGTASLEVTGDVQGEPVDGSASAEFSGDLRRAASAE